MAATFTVTPKARSNCKTRQLRTGVYVSAGTATGGDLNDHMSLVEFALMQPYGSAVVTTQGVVNETLPLRGSATVVTAADQSGVYLLVGR